VTTLCRAPRCSSRSTDCRNVAWESEKAMWWTQPMSVGVRAGLAARSSLVKMVINAWL